MSSSSTWREQLLGLQDLVEVLTDGLAAITRAGEPAVTEPGLHLGFVLRGCRLPRTTFL